MKEKNTKKATSDEHQYNPNAQLKRERELRGWSQSYVADQIDAPYPYYVSRWENGLMIPSPYYRQKLCELFGKNAQELGLVVEEDDSSKLGYSQASRDLNSPTSVSTIFLHDPAIPPLPAETHGLVGREEMLCRLKEQLFTGKSTALSALNGLPGVGKTALAVELAYDAEVRKHFSDGVLWAGLGREPNVPGVLNRWGALLGVTPLEMVKLTSIED